MSTYRSTNRTCHVHLYARPMTVPSEPAPLRADAQRNRERILAAAAQVFATHGLEATLHDVAAHAGVGVGTVYRRFPDKQALVEALFDSAIDDIVATAERAAAIDDPWQALTQLMHDLTARSVADSGLRQVLSDQTGPAKFAVARQRLAKVAGGLLLRAQEAGVVRADLAQVDVAMLWHVLTHVANQTEPVRAGAWERYLEIVLAGLRARPDQRPLDEPPLSPTEVARIRPPRNRGR